MNKKDFKKLFPKLFEEIDSGSRKVKIDSVRWSEENKEQFYPNVIDYLRRCEDDEQGYEIIDFLQKRGELSKEYAEDLRQQIKSSGVRSFGPVKKWGYYEKKFRR